MTYFTTKRAFNRKNGSANLDIRKLTSKRDLKLFALFMQ